MTPPDSAKIICPHCGKRSAPGPLCTQCGAALPGTGRPLHLQPSDAHASDYTVYLLATPVVAAIVALMVALGTHSATGVILVLVAMAIVSAIFALIEYFQAPTVWDVGDPTRAILGWTGFVLMAWPIGYPAYAYRRRRFHLDNLLIGALIVEAVLIAGVVLSGVIIQSGYGKPTAQELASQQKRSNPGLLKASPHWIPDPGDVQLVKTSYLDNCKQRTVEQEVNAYLGSPQWESGADSEGRDFVNVGGTVTYNGKPVPAVFQFVIDKDKQGFRYRAFTINGVPQTIYVAALTLMEMCAAANKAPMVLIPEGSGVP